MSQDVPRYEADLEIARAILEKNEAVASRFFEENHDRLYRFVFSRCGNSQDAEEITQDAWVTAIECLETYKGTSALLTWICSIARFKVSDRFRQRRSQRQKRIADFELAIDGLLSKASSDGILELLEASEVQETLSATMALLPDDYRAALSMKYLEERSVRDIASVMGKSEKATESLLNRAKNAFRDLWKVETGEKISLRKGRKI